jgi:hypothetical protein
MEIRRKLTPKNGFLLAMLVLASLYFLHVHFLVFLAGLIVFGVCLFFRKYTYPTLGFMILCFFLFWVHSFDMPINLRAAAKEAFKSPIQTLIKIYDSEIGIQDETLTPPEVRQMLSLIQKYQLPDFNISPAVEGNVFMSGRLIETAWPIKQETDSKNIFLLSAEAGQYRQCAQLGSEKGIILVHCP